MNLPKEKPIKRGYLDTPQARIYYETLGKGRPLVLLHGNGQSHHVFRSYMRGLSDDYRLILMDSRGHGHSVLKNVLKPFTITDMARDVAALLNYLNIPQAVFLGFSDGANIALEFASLYPERALAVISASGNALPGGLRFPLRLAAGVQLQASRALKALCPGDRLKAFFDRRCQLSVLLLDSPALPEERLKKITAPVLVLAGTRDAIKTSHTRWMAEHIPGSRLLLIPGGTHNVLFGQEKRCLGCIKDFLREHRL